MGLEGKMCISRWAHDNSMAFQKELLSFEKDMLTPKTFVTLAICLFCIYKRGWWDGGEVGIGVCCFREKLQDEVAVFRSFPCTICWTRVFILKIVSPLSHPPKISKEKYCHWIIINNIHFKNRICFWDIHIFKYIFITWCFSGNKLPPTAGCSDMYL